MFWLLTTAILLLLYAVLIFYYQRAWGKLNYFHSTYDSPNHFLSVIIPARNEEKNIAALLNALSKQSYASDFFEIILVDDFSTDRTSQTVKNFSLPNLVLIQPNTLSQNSSKKRAIDTGIQHAKGEIIVTTDADCIPQPKWLETIKDCFVKNEAAFIAAPVKFSHDKTFLHIFQALDFLTLQGITAASVSSGFHMMCNGANLAYSKQAFYKYWVVTHKMLRFSQLIEKLSIKLFLSCCL